MHDALGPDCTVCSLDPMWAVSSVICSVEAHAQGLLVAARQGSSKDLTSQPRCATRDPKNLRIQPSQSLGDDHLRVCRQASHLLTD